MMNISIVSTVKRHPLAISSYCSECGRRVFYVPGPVEKKLVCGACMIDELERTGSVAHTLREGKIIETYKDESTEQLVKHIRRVMEKEQ